MVFVPVSSRFQKMFVMEHGAESGSFRLAWLPSVNTSHIGTSLLMSESGHSWPRPLTLSPLTYPSQRRSMFIQTGDALFLRSVLPLLLWMPTVCFSPVGVSCLYTREPLFNSWLQSFSAHEPAALYPKHTRLILMDASKMNDTPPVVPTVPAVSAWLKISKLG